MAAVPSANMLLPIPSVGTTQGPEYAIDINDALTLVDRHDHTPGKGIAIPVAGLNIDANLSMNSFSLVDIGELTLIAESSASTTPQTLSVAPGGESPQQQDLWYTPDTGVPIQITKNGAVNVVASAIEGETYAAGTFFWTQAQDALPTTPANFDIGSITIRPNTALTMFGVTLQPASAIASQYSINLPLLPAASKLMTLDASGNMVAGTDVDNSTLEISSSTIQVKNQGITAAKILNNTITTNQISLTAGITQGQLAAAALAWRSETLVTVVPSFTVRAATTANGTLSTAFHNGSVIDGVTLATNDKILIKNQTATADNGVYVVAASGSPSRDTAYDTFGELNYAAVSVTSGTVNASTKWFQNNILTSLSDAQSWSKSSTQAYVVPAGVNLLAITINGGGGGGGGGGAGAGSNALGGSGGSGGQGSVPQTIKLPVTPGQTLSFTLGIGGAGGAGGSVAGGTADGVDGTTGGDSAIVASGINYFFKGGTGGNKGLGAGTATADIADAWTDGGGLSKAGGGGAKSSAVNNPGSAGTAGGATSFYATVAAGGVAGAQSSIARGGGSGGGGGAGFAAGGAGGVGNAQIDGTAGGAGSLGAGGGGGGGVGASSGTANGGAGGRGGDATIVIQYLVGGA